MTVFTLHGALLEAASTAPDAVAVTAGDSTLTYGELATRSGRVAAALRQVGVAPGDRVAVAADKALDTVAALYGVMGCGASYVPIDPLMPPLRVGRILDDAGCAAVCADAGRAPMVAEVGSSQRPVVPLGVAADATVTPDAMGRACESDLAYLLYTSGSTGEPKGVMLTHRNALAFVEWGVARFRITADDRLSSHAPFHFDLSVFDLYAAALTGASVHLLTASEAGFGSGMAAAIGRRSLTVWYSVPSALVMLLRSAGHGDLATLRLVLFAGEVFPMKHLRRLRDALPDAVLANLYGPTETNVCTYHVVPAELPAGDDPLPIGRACENQEVFALDADLRPVADGEEGELWVRGPTVMKGYWGDRERTASSLRQHPLHDRFTDPAYRTGDLVRRRGDGAYDFIGRRDHQVKSRGYRIELGEIETALAAHEAVAEAAVAAVPDEKIGNALVAFVSGEPVDELELKRHCSQRLPRYMVPGLIVMMETLPHTSTGKIDRTALARVAAGRVRS